MENNGLGGLVRSFEHMHAHWINAKERLLVCIVFDYGRSETQSRMECFRGYTILWMLCSLKTGFCMKRVAGRIGSDWK